MLSSGSIGVEGIGEEEDIGVPMDGESCDEECWEGEGVEGPRVSGTPTGSGKSWSESP